MGERCGEATASGSPVIVGPPGGATPVVPASMDAPGGRGQPAVGTTAPFELVVTRHGATTTLAVHGELDVEAAPVLARSLESFPGEPGPPSFVVDLDRLSFVDAAGLRAFVPSIRRLAARGERLVIRRPSPLTRTILQVSGLASGLSIES